MLCNFSLFILWMGISDGVEMGRKCEVADWAGAGLACIFMITTQVILTLESYPKIMICVTLFLERGREGHIVFV